MAFVTPYEIALLEVSLNGLFWVNRVVDLFFAVDIVVCFCTGAAPLGFRPAGDAGAHLGDTKAL